MTLNRDCLGKRSTDYDTDQRLGERSTDYDTEQRLSGREVN